MGVDAGQDVLEVFIRVDRVQLAGSDDAVENGGGLSSEPAPYEKVILPADYQRAYCILDGLSKCLDKPSYPQL